MKGDVMDNEMKIVERAMELTKVLVEKIDSLDALMAIVMTALDEWSMAHNVSPKELEDTMDRCIDIMKECHKHLGW